MYMAGHLGIGDEARMDNERDCNNCVYSTRDGNCRKFNCEGTKTVEQIRADVIEELKPYVLINMDGEKFLWLKVDELNKLSFAEQLKEQK